MPNNLPEVPRFAYFITDLDAFDAERLDLAKNVKILKNVMVVWKANLVIAKGPTIIACMLHDVALLLKQGKHWLVVDVSSPSQIRLFVKKKKTPSNYLTNLFQRGNIGMRSLGDMSRQILICMFTVGYLGISCILRSGINDVGPVYKFVVIGKIRSTMMLKCEYNSDGELKGELEETNEIAMLSVLMRV
ncbi:hypothetical protein L6452_01591 [Arctium lappa]|uniref:Uncharacterized protein n=1 Tax=Arctium lappa TaxID=4217 RepID=A0ACB9FIJ8_ARCLA|nr:hypothetical protein L6452_01591 [Arctium lappa]